MDNELKRDILQKNGFTLVEGCSPRDVQCYWFRTEDDSYIVDLDYDFKDFQVRWMNIKNKRRPSYREFNTWVDAPTLDILNQVIDERKNNLPTADIIEPENNSTINNE